MKATGIVRPVDSLGRVVIPKELRKTYGISVNDSVEIFVDGSQIIIRKYEPSCMFCGDASNIVTYKGKVICTECLAKLNKSAETQG